MANEMEELIGQLTLVIQKINSSVELADLLNAIIDVAKNVLDSEGASLLLKDFTSGDMIFHSVSGEKSKMLKGLKVPKGLGFVGHVAETMQPMLSNNVQDDSRFFKEMDIQSEFSTRNIICVPMISFGRFIGVLEVVNSRNREEFTELDLQKLNYISGQAAIAINNRRLYEDKNSRVNELTALYEISQSISYSALDENILSRIMKTIANAIGAEKASIVFYDESRKKLILKAAFGLPREVEQDSEVDLFQTITGHVFRNGDPLIISNVREELNAINLQAKNDDTRSYKTNSFISVPVMFKNKIIGVLSLSDKNNGAPFDAFDLRVLSTAASQLAEIYQNFLFQQTIEERQRLSRELDIAAEIQRKILPIIPATIKNHQLAAFNKPAKYVGGDFYYYHRFDENKYCISIADVSGKGIPSALFMGTARNVLRAEMEIHTHPHDLLYNANKYIFEDSEAGMFVTLAYFLIDSHNNLITYGCAGHNDTILIRARDGAAVRFNAKGCPLGVCEDSDYEERVYIYEPGDLLILTTDGVTEYLGDDDFTVGEEKLIEIGRKYLNKTPLDLITYFRDELKENALDNDVLDDFTILAVKF